MRLATRMAVLEREIVKVSEYAETLYEDNYNLKAEYATLRTQVEGIPPEILATLRGIYKAFATLEGKA